MIEKLHQLYQQYCFNRTFMELKYQLKTSMIDLQPSFNRTFMELKLQYVALQDVFKQVLIVPLWN